MQSRLESEPLEPPEPHELLEPEPLEPQEPHEIKDPEPLEPPELHEPLEPEPLEPQVPRFQKSWNRPGLGGSLCKYLSK